MYNSVYVPNGNNVVITLVLIASTVQCTSYRSVTNNVKLTSLYISYVYTTCFYVGLIQFSSLLASQRLESLRLCAYTQPKWRLFLEALHEYFHGSMVHGFVCLYGLRRYCYRYEHSVQKQQKSCCQNLKRGLF